MRASTPTVLVDPREIYRRERNSPTREGSHDRLMAEAQRLFDAALADDKAKRETQKKGGRPKMKPLNTETRRRAKKVLERATDSVL
jgi:hypothetical protein